ncbi:hypothetical protein Vretifemale_2570 [Volvox reticuliferus]|nr:hypothetical protein Vretifemale_2570 [Volvox reticuliferus]
MSLRNDIAISCVLHEAAARGFHCAATGDGADELLGGYGFTHGLEPAAWAAHRAHMARVMEFGSARLGKHLGIFVASPFTHPAVKETALRLRKDDCVQVDGFAGVDGRRSAGASGTREPRRLEACLYQAESPSYVLLSLQNM